MKGKKLLIITQVVDYNSRLSFFLDWVKEFAKYYKKIEVICLQKGEYNLPCNVNVNSLGKENNKSKFKLIVNFYNLIISKKYDKVFVHMNPIWVVLGYPIFKLKKADLFLWYTHKAISFKLKIAKIFTKKIFTASKESFSLKHTQKIMTIGHGISENVFHRLNLKKENFIMTVGRITKIKNIEIIIKALKHTNKRLNLKIVGEAITKSDLRYKAFLTKLIKRLNLKEEVEFVGNISQQELNKMYNMSLLSINASPRGGMDKVVLESLFCETPVLVSNITFKSIFKSQFSKYYFREKDYMGLSRKINLITKNKRDIEILKLTKTIKRDFFLKGLIKKIVNEMNR